MSTGKVETIVFCERCGARCRCDGASSNAKMLRRSKEPKGLCVNCAVHDWMRNTYPINIHLAEYGPKVLLLPHIREQFAEIMRVGYADAKPDEINWTLINENWDLPFPHKIKPSATNPCSQKVLDVIKRKGIPLPRPSVGEIKNMPICETFEELNEINPGLGDKLENLFTDIHSKDNSKEKKMAKKNSMQKKVERTEKGEQMPLMDVGPENNKEIVDAVRLYKVHQKDRLTAGKKEVDQKEVVKKLVLKSKLQPLKSGVIKFTCDNAEIEVTPRDVLITIKEVKPKKPRSPKND